MRSEVQLLPGPSESSVRPAWCYGTKRDFLCPQERAVVWIRGVDWVDDVNDGFDYTFMAYRPDLPGVSRANILFLYKYLSENNEGYLDLGGGISEGDALARFKLGMGGIETKFNRMRFISKACSVFSELDIELENLLQERWP